MVFLVISPLIQTLDDSPHLFILDILLKAPFLNLSIELSLPGGYCQHIHIY